MSEIMEAVGKKKLDEQDKAELLNNPVTHEMMEELERLMEISNNILARQSSTAKPAEIWDLTVEDGLKEMKVAEPFTTIYVMGSAEGGKSTLINLFLEKKEKTGQNTLALEYAFARRVNTALENEVCQFWELGGDVRDSTKLIKMPIIGSQDLDLVTVLIVLDLSQPKSMLSVLDEAMNGLRSAFSEAIRRLDKATAVTLTQRLENALHNRLENVPEGDQQYLKAFHLPVVLVGTKYDLFQNLEPEIVKTITRVLRVIAHIIGAALVFYTREDYTLKRRFRELISHYAFNTKFPKDTCHENGECLFIPAGSDSFEKMWPSLKPDQYNVAYCRRYYETKLGQDVNRPRRKGANAADDLRFVEPDIDKTRTSILEELHVQVMRRKRFRDGVK